MPRSCLLYYITDRTAFGPDEPTRRERLLHRIAAAARAGVDYIQLRERDLPTRELESLAREAVRIVRDQNKQATGDPQSTTALLINSRTDIALAAGADGVHLRSDDISPEDVRKIWRCPENTSGAELPFDKRRSDSTGAPLIGVSCHSPQEVEIACQAGASFAVFAPVFEKKDSPGTVAAGLAQLEEACRTSIPVLALGGINLKNAEACLRAGAAGIAAIRLFQEGNVADVADYLRRL